VRNELPGHLVVSRIISTAALAALSVLTILATALAEEDGNGLIIPKDPFRPSNVQTTTGKPISVTDFIPAARCAHCHADTFQSWSQSLHRNAGREPFYDESVAILRRTRPVEFSRHCEGCHLPVALISGALKTGSKVPHLFDDEGVTCSVCHSIVETTLEGTGSYTIAPPALIVTESGRPMRDATDEQILADVEGHRRAVMRPLLRTSEFCAACHKSSVPPDLSGYEFVQKGFDVYDEWQQSSFSRQTVVSLGSGLVRNCQDCHMERVPSTRDYAEKNGNIASHRWRGANTAVPLFYGFEQQLRLTQRFLRSEIIHVDIFSLENERTGERSAPLGIPGRRRFRFSPGDQLTAEVIVSSAGIGHSFPPELRDVYDAWVEFSVLDDDGNEVLQRATPSGVSESGSQRHTYRQVLLDRTATPLLHHDVWLAIAKGCDDRIVPTAPELLRFRFRVRPGLHMKTLRLRATVKYRRFTKAYSDYVLAARKVGLKVPTITMATCETVIESQSGSARQLDPTQVLANRWDQYGLALLETSDRRAVEASSKAAAMDPQKEFGVDQAAGELRTSRIADRDALGRKALTVLDSAFPIEASEPPRARFWRAIALLDVGNIDAAVTLLSELEAAFPKDVEVKRRLGIALATQERWAEARRRFEEALRINPLDADSYLWLGSISAREGMNHLAADYNGQYRILSRWAAPPIDGVCDDVKLNLMGDAYAK
jgi:hypothetical protein